jgi:hypothetical protein
MANQIGIRTVIFVPAAVTTISNTVLAPVTGLTQAVAPHSQWYFKFWIPFSVGATGGVKFQVVAPAAPTIYLLSWKLYQPGAPGTLLDTAVQVASAAFANAAAGALNDFMEADMHFVNGATAGNVQLQFAQNSSVASAITILQGGRMECFQM